MQWSLFLLLLMGPCSFLAFRNYEYHFIDQEKSWDEAQTFCREKYTDLAVVDGAEGMKRLSTDLEKDAWIGLYSQSGVIKNMWNWTLPENKSCEVMLRRRYHGHDVCRLITTNDQCKDVNRFLCFTEGNPSTKYKYYLCYTNMTCKEAQTYCRKHYKDPAKGLSHLNFTGFPCMTDSYQLHLGVEGACPLIKKILNQPSSDHRWFLGLLRNNWKWSSGSNFSFRYWDDEHIPPDPNGKLCAVLRKNEKWKTADCSEKKPFFCYDDKMILIKEKKTWEEALNYCRENHKDLVSITDVQQQEWVKRRAKNALTSYVWLGLHYSCALDMWFWVSDQLVCYNDWAAHGQNDVCRHTGAIEKEGHNQWYSREMTSKYNFICAV